MRVSAIDTELWVCSSLDSRSTCAGHQHPTLALVKNLWPALLRKLPNSKPSIATLKADSRWRSISCMSHPGACSQPFANSRVSVAANS